MEAKEIKLTSRTRINNIFSEFGTFQISVVRLIARRERNKQYQE